MRKRQSLPKLLCTLLFNVLLMPSSHAIAADLPVGNLQARAFTEADAIEMTNLGDPDYWHHNQSVGRVAHFSPDQTQMVIVLRRGNLSEGVTEYSLLHYRSKDLLQVPAPQPNVILRVSSRSNREVFASPRWLADNRTLLFLGERPGEERQVFSVDIHTHTLKQLTRSRANVSSYSASADGMSVLYMAEEPQSDIWNDQTRRRGIVVEDQSLAELIAGRLLADPSRGGELYYLAAGPSAEGTDHAKRIEVPDRLDRNFTPLLSPDGRHALLRVFASSAPEKWRAYTDPLIAQWMNIMQFIIIDTQTGAVRTRVDAPQVHSNGGIDGKWAADSTSVLVTLLYLPIDGVSAQERQRRLSGPFTAEIDLSGAVRALAPERILQKARIERWESSTNVATLIRQSADGMQRTFFKKQKNGWRAIEPPSTWRSPAEVSLREGMNQPPRIVVLNPRTKQELTLLDLNPQFKNLKLARQEEIQWQASDGTHVRGGLYYPPDYVHGKRYPLVIQTHGWTPKLFAVDGVFVSAFAAQALANKDMLVLQAWDFPAKDNAAAWQRWLTTKIGTLGMHQLEQSIYEGAIDHLDTAGLIDRNKVGIIGFSFTCWSVKYALSHSRPGYRFAAAAVSDGYDGSYFNYAVHAHKPAMAQLFERVIGDKPYGPGLQVWLKNGAGFNIDKVDTPLRMLPLGNPESLLNDWEWFTLLRRMNKPVELVMVEDGTHTLVKPWDRMVVSGGNVDWFDFWLNDRKDPAAEKVEQYERWEGMRP